MTEGEKAKEGGRLCEADFKAAAGEQLSHRGVKYFRLNTFH